MKKIFYRTGCLFAATLLLSGCKDFFDPETPDTLQEREYMTSFTELYSGYFGMATTVMKVVDQGMYIEGLRGEFLEPTYNAPQDFWDLYNYVDKRGGTLAGNDLASPKGYYEIILNANDYIKHVFEYVEENPLGVDDLTLRGLVGGALRYKAWAYLQIIKYWGEAVYIDDPLIKYQDISQYPLWSFDQILDKCIDLVTVGVNGIDGRTEFNWVEALDVATATNAELEDQDRSRNKTCPPAVALLAELYLWKGDYAAVKENYIRMFDVFQRYSDTYAYNPYVLDTENRIGSWERMFRQYSEREDLAGQSYNYEYQQVNKLLPYLSTRYDGVRWTDSDGQEYTTGYYLRPSAYAMDKFMTIEGRWGANGTVDNPTAGAMDRGRGNTFADETTDRPYVYKFIHFQNNNDNWYRTVPWISMYRATGMQLYLVEALINMGRFEEALIFFNGGGKDLATHTDANTTLFKVYIDPSTGRFRVGSPLEGYPIQLGGVNNNGAQGYSNQGIRGRGNAQPRGWEVSRTAPQGWDGFVFTPNPDITVDQRYLDSLVAEEWFLESSGEGHAMQSMIRIARRWPELRPAFAAKVAAKYTDPGVRAAVEASLSANIENWFIKFPITE